MIQSAFKHHSYPRIHVPHAKLNVNQWKINQESKLEEFYVPPIDQRELQLVPNEIRIWLESISHKNKYRVMIVTIEGIHAWQ